MPSSGGLTDAHAFQGKDAILSGPVGGIVGMARTTELAFAGASMATDPGTQMAVVRSVLPVPGPPMRTAFCPVSVNSSVRNCLTPAR